MGSGSDGDPGQESSPGLFHDDNMVGRGAAYLGLQPCKGPVDMPDRSVVSQIQSVRKRKGMLAGDYGLHLG